MAAAIGRPQLGGKGLEMRLQTGADLERSGLDLGEPLLLEQAAQRRVHPVARQEVGPAAGMGRGIPPEFSHFKGSLQGIDAVAATDRNR